jgi:DNA-binding CsgD family transcriptional regulator
VVSPQDILTPREREVLSLVAQGHTANSIAAQLNLGPRTVEWHRERVRRKLGVTTRAELFRVALALGLLDHAVTGDG